MTTLTASAPSNSEIAISPLIIDSMPVPVPKIIISSDPQPVVSNVFIDPIHPFLLQQQQTPALTTSTLVPHPVLLTSTLIAHEPTTIPVTIPLATSLSPTPLQPKESLFTGENIDSTVNEEEFGKIIDTTRSFRIQNQKIFLTYPNRHVPKDVLRKWINDTFSGTTLIEIAHETSPMGYHHTHVLINFGRLFRKSGSDIFDIIICGDRLHPNIRTISTIQHWTNCLNYLSKQDKDCAHLFSSPSMIQGIWNCETPQDALLKYCGSDLKAAPSILAIHSNRPEKIVPRKLTLFPWQKDLVDELVHPADDRKIIWYVDLAGRTGKSKLCKYLASTAPKEYFLVSQLGGAKDFATIAIGAKQNGWSGHCLLVDFARDAERKSIYEPLEHMKDGTLTAIKYKGQTVHFDVDTHIVVFANFYPNVLKFTQDRWDIRSISLTAPFPNPTFSVKHMTYYEVLTEVQKEAEQAHLLTGGNTPAPDGMRITFTKPIPSAPIPSYKPGDISIERRQFLLSLPRFIPTGATPEEKLVSINKHYISLLPSMAHLPSLPISPTQELINYLLTATPGPAPIPTAVPVISDERLSLLSTDTFKTDGKTEEEIRAHYISIQPQLKSLSL